MAPSVEAAPKGFSLGLIVLYVGAAESPDPHAGLERDGIFQESGNRKVNFPNDSNNIKQLQQQHNNNNKHLQTKEL